jgi:hypothetical protein
MPEHQGLSADSSLDTYADLLSSGLSAEVSRIVPSLHILELHCDPLRTPFPQPASNG